MRNIAFICIALIIPFLTIAQEQIGDDINGEASFNNMGWDSAISGDGQTIVVGAPGSSISAYGVGQVKVLSFNGTDWVQVGADLLGALDEDNFGRAVDITNDGNTIVVGAQYSDANGFNSGSVQVFDFDGTQWNLVFEHYGDEENDVFGMSLDMSGDGNHVICGAWINVDNTTKEGYAKVFQFDNSMWSQVGQTITGETPGIFSGASSSISSDGNIIAFGSWGNDENGTDSGEVEVFELVGNNWQQLGADIQGDSSFQRFGWALDLSNSGTILAVGAPQENNTRFYKYEGGAWNMVGNAIPGAAVNDDFGYSVDLSSDGTKAVIGDPNNNVNGSDSGFAQVFDITNVLSVEDFDEVEFSIFPNPTKSKLSIQSNVAISEFSIVDINGRVLFPNNNLSHSQEISINVENLSNGVYFLMLKANVKTHVLKFIKD